MTGMEYNFQKYDQGRIQYLGLPYDTGNQVKYIDVRVRPGKNADFL